MKKPIVDTVTKDQLNDYLAARMKLYLEKFAKTEDKKWEKEFYSNIMEIVTLMDYVYTPVSLTNLSMLSEVREKHYKQVNMWTEI